ncbi:MAG: hypothetical protein IJV67_07365 [Clostridia bacterium]|nr:hypothetical protein [Clostridia bacterium]
MKLLKKLIIIIAIIAVCGVGALIDYFISLSYDINFVSVERLSETDDVVLDENGNEIPADWGIADGQTKVRFVIQLTRNGKPIADHTLYVKTNRNVLERTTTDKNGMIVIDYRCYRANGSGAPAPITLTVRDEDNSVFVFVPRTASYVLNMARVKTSEGSGMVTDDIFYDLEEQK